MIKNKITELGNCSIELVKKTNKDGIIYYACELILPNNERRQIGFAIDYYVIRKKIKGGNKE